MDVYLSDPQDLLSDSGTDSEEPGNIGAHQERKAGTSPHHQQSASFMDLLTRLGDPEVCRRVPDVLGHMECSSTFRFCSGLYAGTTLTRILYQTTRLALQERD